MTHEQFYTVTKEIEKHDDKDAFIAAASSVCESKEELSDIWRATHLSFGQIVKASGLTQLSFSKRFLIPLRTVENWVGNVSTPPIYVKIMILDELNMLPKRVPGEVTTYRIIQFAEEFKSAYDLTKGCTDTDRQYRRCDDPITLAEYSKKADALKDLKSRKTSVEKSGGKFRVSEFWMIEECLVYDEEFDEYAPKEDCDFDCIPSDFPKFEIESEDGEILKTFDEYGEADQFLADHDDEEAFDGAFIRCDGAKIY